MFYNLPTEDPFTSGRHIKMDDLIDGIQDFYLFDITDAPIKEGELETVEQQDRREFPFRIILRVNMLTIEEKETINLKFRTADARDFGISCILFDLFSIGANPRNKVRPRLPVVDHQKENLNAMRRRSVDDKPKSLGNVSNSAKPN